MMFYHRDQSQSTEITSFVRRNVYTYHPRSLLIAYGLAIAGAVFCLIVGSIAMLRHGLSYTSNFSTILRATRDPRLHRVGSAHDGSGAEPASREVKDTKLIYRSRTGEAWAGFAPVDENVGMVRRKSVGGGTIR